MNRLVIRDVNLKDAKQILDIYAPYVADTAITYEYVAPTLREFKKRIKTIKSKYPYIVAELDGKIVGYAYAGVFHAREAYKHSCELSIYLDQNSRKLGIGTKLYAELENKLKERDFCALYACIAATPRKDDKYLTDASIKFHEAIGFRRAGYFDHCAIKFDQWYDMVYYQKLI